MKKKKENKMTTMTMRNPYLHLASNHGYTTDKKDEKKKKKEITFANDRIKWSRAHDHDMNTKKKCI